MLFHSELYWKKFHCFSAAIWQGQNVTHVKGALSLKYVSPQRKKYFSCLVIQHICCWGVASGHLESILQFHSQHSYKVSKCYISCFTEGGIAARRQVTTWRIWLKQKAALLVPRMKMPELLCLASVFKVWTSEEKEPRGSERVLSGLCGEDGATSAQRGWGATTVGMEMGRCRKERVKPPEIKTNEKTSWSRLHNLCHLFSWPDSTVASLLLIHKLLL